MTRSSAASKKASTVKSAAVIVNNDENMYPEWLGRRQEIEDRLKIISVPPPSTAKPKATTGSNKKPRARRRGGGKSQGITGEPDNITSTSKEALAESTKTALVPYTPKIDVHWDFVMKELMWLGADFQGERKRQVGSARRLGASIIKFHENKEKRRLRQLQMAEIERKKLAARLGRKVKGWWTKLEK